MKYYGWLLYCPNECQKGHFSYISYVIVTIDVIHSSIQHCYICSWTKEKYNFFDCLLKIRFSNLTICSIIWKYRYVCDHNFHLKQVHRMNIVCCVVCHTHRRRASQSCPLLWCGSAITKPNQSSLKGNEKINKYSHEWNLT